METELGYLASSAKLDNLKPEKTALSRTGNPIKIKDLQKELIGFKGIISRFHAFTLRPFGIKTLKRL